MSRRKASERLLEQILKYILAKNKTQKIDGKQAGSLVVSNSFDCPFFS